MRRRTALAAAVSLAVSLAGCGREAPVNAETLARDRFLRDLAEREGLGDTWYLISRADVVFEDGWSLTQMIDPQPRPAWNEVSRTCSSARALAARWMGAAAHLRVRGRGASMRLVMWGTIDVTRMLTHPRVTATFDGLEVFSQVVDDDGRFTIETVIPGEWIDGWSDVYVNLSSIHEPWRTPEQLRIARIERVAWEPAP